MYIKHFTYSSDYFVVFIFTCSFFKLANVQLLCREVANISLLSLLVLLSLLLLLLLSLLFRYLAAFSWLLFFQASLSQLLKLRINREDLHNVMVAFYEHWATSRGLGCTIFLSTG